MGYSKGTRCVHTTSSDFPNPLKYFGTTHWSLVLDAGQANPEAARPALEVLCRTYWYPLYAFARGHGASHHDAEDLTQGFLQHLISTGLVAEARPEQGRFRSFLLTCFKNYRLKEYARSQRKKRGGGTPMVPLDEMYASERFAVEAHNSLTPEERFDRNWAIRILEQTQELLKAEFESAGRTRDFQRLRGWLPGGRRQDGYAEAARKFGKSEAALKMEVSRLKKRYREILRQVVAQTLTDPNDIDDELAYLFKLVANF